jgi:hypothetical protein
MQRSPYTEETKNNDENTRGAEGTGGQLLSVFLADAMRISNQMAKDQNAVSVFRRVQNVAPAFNTVGSSSLHTRINAAARLMQRRQCALTHLNTSKRFLQHASNTQRTQELA